MAIAVRNGSFNEKYWTYELIIEGHKSPLHRMSATSTTTGHPADQEAQRSELAGLLHTVMIVDILSEKYNIKEGEKTYSC